MKENVFARHALAGALAFALVFGFWMSRPQWTEEMRFWKAVGDGSWVLLVLTLAVGPMARLWSWSARLSPWRRETGVWFGLLALGHGFLIMGGWARWDVGKFFGYEFVPQLERTARIEPGFGLANLIGLVALFWALMLTATSSNWAMRSLGGSAWKWLHNGAYVVFYLVALHTFYFLFMHYTPSFHTTPPAADWFQYPFVALAMVVPLLQASAFMKTVMRKRGSSTEEPKKARKRGVTAPGLPPEDLYQPALKTGNRQPVPGNSRQR